MRQHAGFCNVERARALGRIVLSCMKQWDAKCITDSHVPINAECFHFVVNASGESRLAKSVFLDKMHRWRNPFRGQGPVYAYLVIFSVHFWIAFICIQGNPQNTMLWISTLEAVHFWIFFYYRWSAHTVRVFADGWAEYGHGPPASVHGPAKGHPMHNASITGKTQTHTV